MNAIRSVLNQQVSNLYVMVSDNSEEGFRGPLAAFCEELANSRLLYVTPPTTLPMSHHWDWAIRQALKLDDASHFIYLTDRSLFKPGALLNITELARQYPDKVISYDWVTIFDHLSPIIVERQRQTGQLLEVPASRLLFLSSRLNFPHSLPRMMNCSVPRSLLERMQTRFGNVFASISPDYNFCYRSLELVDSILYYDYAAFVSYAILRSNGVGVLGIPTDANADFWANMKLGGHRGNYAVPVPAFQTGSSYIMQEYCLVQREIASQKFPKLSIVNYMVQNLKEVLTILAYKLPQSILGSLIHLRNKCRKTFSLLRSPVAKEKPSRGFELFADALDYAISIPPNDDASGSHLGVLGGPAQS